MAHRPAERDRPSARVGDTTHRGACDKAQEHAMPDENVTTTEAPPAAPEVKEESKTAHDDPKFRDAVEARRSK